MAAQPDIICIVVTSQARAALRSLAHERVHCMVWYGKVYILILFSDRTISLQYHQQPYLSRP